MIDRRLELINTYYPLEKNRWVFDTTKLLREEYK